MSFEFAQNHRNALTWLTCWTDTVAFSVNLYILTELMTKYLMGRDVVKFL